MNEFFFCSAVIATTAVSALCSWVAAERKSGSFLWAIAAGGVSAFLTMTAMCAALVLGRERPEFVKLSLMEELTLLAAIFGGAATIGGMIIGGLCLIYRWLTTSSR